MNIMNGHSTPLGARGALRSLRLAGEEEGTPVGLTGRIFRRSALFLALLGLLALAAVSPAAAQSFSDNSFTSGWVTGVYAQAPAAPLVTAVAVPIAGTPNRRRLTHNFFYGYSIFATHLRSGFVVTPSAGAITNMQFQYTLQSVNGLQGAYSPLIFQSGKYYALAFFDGANATAQTYGHTVTAANFALLRPDGSRDTSQHPDFSCQGAEIVLGYYTGNSNGTTMPAPTPIAGVSDLSNFSVNVTTEPCLNPCCPPWNVTSIKNQLHLNQPGLVPSNYSFTIVPSAPYTGQMQAYLDFLHAMNPAITTLTMTWTITDQGNGPLPAPVTSTIMMGSATRTWVCSATGCPPPGLNTNFLSGILMPNRWYRVTTRLSLNNGLTYWPANCPDAFFDYNMREIP